jgi:hypothetical protein
MQPDYRCCGRRRGFEQHTRWASVCSVVHERMTSFLAVDYTVARSMRQGPASRMPNRLSSLFTSLLLGVLVCFALTGCGQKGDLYLPDDAVSQESR